MSSNVAGLGLLALFYAAFGLPQQNVDPGRKAFEARCASCHGADGNGGEMGPPIVLRLVGARRRAADELIREGLPREACRRSAVADPEMADLVKFLRTIQRRARGQPMRRLTLQTTDGRDDRRPGARRRLRRCAAAHRRRARAPAAPCGRSRSRGDVRDAVADLQRRSRRQPLHDARPRSTRTTVGRLAPKWMFTVPGAGRCRSRRSSSTESCT